LSNKAVAAFFCLFFISLGCAHAQETGHDTLETIASTPAVSTGTPAVELPETYFDFGEMMDGNDYIHAFLIWNTGTGILEIQKVLPG
jgi:hypothetical protein